MASNSGDVSFTAQPPRELPLPRVERPSVPGMHDPSSHPAESAHRDAANPIRSLSPRRALKGSDPPGLLSRSSLRSTRPADGVQTPPDDIQSLFARSDRP